MVVFLVGDEERQISGEDAKWLIEELMASDEEKCVAVAARLNRAACRTPVTALY